MNYKECPNGHYYVGDECPFCKKSATETGPTEPTKKTGFYDSKETWDPGKYSEPPEYWHRGSESSSSSSSSHDTMFGSSSETTGGTIPTGSNGGTVGIDGFAADQKANNPRSKHTIFGDEEVEDTPCGTRRTRENRETRRLVGWIVSYTLDKMGVDFKLYEGRNTIGRDPGCSITVFDGRVSAQHAVLLFRSGKYSITDSQSSHGTFVNGEDIELEPRYLNDGDMIQVGDTVFKFRTAF